MSAQMALMGASAAMSMAGSVMAGSERAAAAGAQGRSLDFQSMVQRRQGELQEWQGEQALWQGEFSAKNNDLNADIAANSGYLKRAMLGRYDVEAAGYELQGEEVMLQAAQEERQRRAAIASLLSFNAADLASRGVEGGIGSSADTLEKHNVSESEYDIRNIRRVGESKRRYLSFAADDSRINKKVAEIDAKNSDIEAENIRLESTGIRLNAKMANVSAKLGASMTNLGAVATKQAATQAWSQVGPATTAGWLQGAMSLGQMALRYGGSFGGGGGGPRAPGSGEIA